MSRLRPEGIDFLDRAPIRLHYDAAVSAPPEQVFAAIAADPSTWTQWFPGLLEGAYTSPPPYGVGTLREVKVRAAGRYQETLLAWDEGTRWCYRVDESSRPIANVLIEDWTVAPTADGATVGWTFALEPTPLFKLTLRAGGHRIVGRTFHTALRNLDRHLQQGARP